MPTAARPRSDARDRILTAATRLFAQRGYNATSVQSVATEVGIRAPSLLYHFPSKELLRDAVLEALLARWKGPSSQALLVFGQVPMFFYLVHLPLIHVAGVIHAYLRYGDTHIPATVDLSLPLIYLAWMVLLAALWPACVAWRRFKRAKRQWWWLSYL